MYSQQVQPIVPNQQLLQPGSNVIVIPGPCPSRGPYTSYRGGLSKKLGIAQIFLAALSMIFNIVMIAHYDSGIAKISSGIWCAVLYTIAGAFGIAAEKGSRCLVISHMVMSILAAAFSSIPFSLNIIGAIDRDDDDYFGRNNPIWPYIVMILVSTAEAAVAIFASILGCSAACQNEEPLAQNVVGGGGVQYTVTTGAQNLILLQPSQYQPQASGSVPTNQNVMSPPQYEEKPPLAWSGH